MAENTTAIKLDSSGILKIGLDSLPLPAAVQPSVNLCYKNLAG